MKLDIKYSSKGSRGAYKRYQIQILLLATIFLFGIGPIIADQVANSDSQPSNLETSTVQSSIEPTPSSLPNESASPSPEISNSNNVPSTAEQSTSDSATSSIAPSPSKKPPHAIENQNMVIQIPRVQRLDPRAKQFNLPQVNFYSTASPYLMLCMNSSWGVIDVQLKGVSDWLASKDVFLEGDLSNNVRISGTSYQVMMIFNGHGGLRMRGPDGKSVVGASLYLRFVAISDPTDNFTLCGQSQASGQWLVQLQPLGLQVDTKKNPLNLGDKGRKP